MLVLYSSPDLSSPLLLINRVSRASCTEIWVGYGLANYDTTYLSNRRGYILRTEPPVPININTRRPKSELQITHGGARWPCRLATWTGPPTGPVRISLDLPTSATSNVYGRTLISVIRPRLASHSTSLSARHVQRNYTRAELCYIRNLSHQALRLTLAGKKYEQLASGYINMLKCVMSSCFGYFDFVRHKGVAWLPILHQRWLLLYYYTECLPDVDVVNSALLIWCGFCVAVLTVV